MVSRRRPHGWVAAGSTVVAIVAGVVVNLLTAGWSLPLLISLVGLAATWIALEVWRERAGRHADTLNDEGANRTRLNQRSLSPPWGALPTAVRGRAPTIKDLVDVLNQPDGR